MVDSGVLRRGGWFYALAAAVLAGSIVWALLLPSTLVDTFGCDPAGNPSCTFIYDHRDAERFLIAGFGAFIAFVVWAFTYVARHA